MGQKDQRYKIIDGLRIPVMARKCSNCKGTFDATPEWHYKHLNAWCCSYNCMQAVRKRSEEKKLQRIAEKAAARKGKKVTLHDNEVFTEGLTPEQEAAVIEKAKQIREERKKEEATMQENLQNKIESDEAVNAAELLPDVEQVRETAANIQRQLSGNGKLVLLDSEQQKYLVRMVENRLLEIIPDGYGIEWLLDMVSLLKKLREAMQ